MNINTTILLPLVCLVAVTAATSAWAQEDTLTGTIQIGALVPISGEISSAGDDIRAALEVALDDFNAYLAESGATWDLDLVIEDTESLPTTSLNKAQALHARGITTILGPATSTNLQSVKGYADKNNMLLVSCCSTTPALNIANDSVYRLVPNDLNQAAAFAKMLEEDGIQGLVIVWRSESYGDGLKNAVVENFAKDGREVLFVSYFPGTKTFALEVEFVDNHVSSLAERHGIENVGVLLVSFDESLSIIQEASQYEQLGNVRWYGSESMAKVDYLIEDDVAVDFLNMVGFTSLQVLLASGAERAQIQDAISEKLGGSEPITFVYSAYDSLWVVGKSIMKTGSADTADIKNVFADVAAGHSGAMRSSEVNDDGDLVLANYQVVKIEDSVWIDQGKYVSEHNIMTTSEQPEGEVQVGALYPLTGDASSVGVVTLDAVELGVAHFNEFLDSINAKWDMTLVAEDTATNPNTALDKAQTLNARGIDIIIGPITSGGASSVKPYADINDMILISCCSTAPSLSIAGDSVFRIIPDDLQQSVGLGKLMESEGITAVVPIWRGDSYGDGLQAATKKDFESRGYTFLEGVRYAPDSTEYGLSVSVLDETVQKAIDVHGSDNVAVLIIAFDEYIQILQNADRHESLNDVRWFGSEAMAKKGDVLNDELTREFVKTVRLTALQVAESDSDIHDMVEAYFIEKYGETSTPFVYQSYDIPWLVGLSILQSGSTDVDTIMTTLPNLAATYEGATGSTVLNEAGDLASTDYWIWSVIGDVWVRVGTYIQYDDSIQPVQ